MIYKTSIVPYSPGQMYELVNDVEAYPSFLPWCKRAVLHEQEEQRVIATLGMGIGKLNQEFTTENTMRPGERIDIRLVRGPFTHLNGYWQFTEQDNGNCKVVMEMDFEFSSKWQRLTLNKAFEQAHSSLIGVFTRRANQIYGDT